MTEAEEIAIRAHIGGAVAVWRAAVAHGPLWRDVVGAEWQVRIGDVRVTLKIEGSGG